MTQYEDAGYLMDSCIITMLLKSGISLDIVKKHEHKKYGSSIYTFEYGDAII